MTTEDQPTSGAIRPCPFCAEDIQLAAIRCKHCGSVLAEPPNNEQSEGPTSDSGSIGPIAGTDEPSQAGLLGSQTPTRSRTLILAGGVAALLLLCGICSGISIAIGSSSKLPGGATEDAEELARLYAKHELRDLASEFQEKIDQLRLDGGSPHLVELGEMVVEEHLACANRIEDAAGGLTDENLVSSVNAEYLALSLRLAKGTRRIAEKQEEPLRTELLEKATRYEKSGPERTSDRPRRHDGSPDTVAQWLDSRRPLKAKAWVSTTTVGETSINILSQNEFSWTTSEITLNGEFRFSRSQILDGRVTSRFSPMLERHRHIQLKHFLNPEGQKFGFTNARGIHSIEITTEDGRKWAGVLSPPP